MEFGVIVFIVIAIVLFLVFIRTLKTEKQAAIGQEERLKDEKIYEPLTGKYLTLEEAENGIIVPDDAFDRVKSDQEIEENYSEDQREVEYCVRHMIQSGFSETEDDRVYELIDHSKLFEPTESYHINYLWEVKPDHFIGIAYVSYNYQAGRHEALGHESQLFGIIQGKLNESLKKYRGVEFVEIGNTQFFKVATILKYQNFKEVLSLIEQHS